MSSLRHLKLIMQNIISNPANTFVNSNKWQISGQINCIKSQLYLYRYILEFYEGLPIMLLHHCEQIVQY